MINAEHNLCNTNKGSLQFHSAWVKNPKMNHVGNIIESRTLGIAGQTCETALVLIATVLESLAEKIPRVLHSACLLPQRQQVMCPLWQTLLLLS